MASRGILSRFWAQRHAQAMVIPGIVWMAVFCYIPMAGIVIAFKQFNIVKPIAAAPWVGLKHFQDFFGDERFWGVLKNTLGISGLKLVVGFPLPIVFALLLNELRRARFKRLVQTISYLPHFISWVILGGILMAWSTDTGLLTRFLVAIRVIPEPTYLLAEPGLFWMLATFTEAWRELGWGAIIYIAAISAIDPQLYEAATVDGAGRFRKMWNVTLPSIQTTVALLFILSVSGLMDSNFGQIFVLKNNLNAPASDVIDIFVYRMGVVSGRFSFATAAGLFKSMVSLCLLVFANASTRRLTGSSLF